MPFFSMASLVDQLDATYDRRKEFDRMKRMKRMKGMDRMESLAIPALWISG